MLLHLLVDFQYGRLVAAAVAVVRSAEDGNYVAVLAPVVTLRHV